MWFSVWYVVYSLPIVDYFLFCFRFFLLSTIFFNNTHFSVQQHSLIMCLCIYETLFFITFLSCVGLFVCLFSTWEYSSVSAFLLHSFHPFVRAFCLSCLYVVFLWEIFPTWLWCNHCYHRISILEAVDKHESSWKTVCHSQSQLKFSGFSIQNTHTMECVEQHLMIWCKCGIINVHLNYCYAFSMATGFHSEKVKQIPNTWQSQMKCGANSHPLNFNSSK